MNEQLWVRRGALTADEHGGLLADCARIADRTRDFFAPGLVRSASLLPPSLPPLPSLPFPSLLS